MLFIIFGLPGAGKSYLGNVLQKTFGFFHYDGDDALPMNMKKILIKGERITNRQRSIFFNKLLQQIKKISAYHKRIAVSQTFIKEQYRLLFAKHFPKITFLLIHTDTLIREKRLARRKIFPLKKRYQHTMSLMFEPPRIAHLIINNNAPGKKMLITQLQTILPSLNNMLVD
jgi:gluconate kinase